ncbi:hypothetical protein DPMN_184692 [Dreissena polymorpha]|uniref:Uncharacterized protein n=1 Tax=Dreissena polymorpha TaxID=45954 RepID=A0A9D4I7M9_DREPO|nr:hypothetical protein DPMN_184692 [Dreissena polymorpha]
MIRFYVKGYQLISKVFPLCTCRIQANLDINSSAPSVLIIDPNSSAVLVIYATTRSQSTPLSSE